MSKTNWYEKQFQIYNNVKFSGVYLVVWGYIKSNDTKKLIKTDEIPNSEKCITCYHISRK